MKDIYIASLVSLALALATAPNVALAQPPSADADEAPRPVRLDVDYSAVGDRAKGIDDVAREDLAPVFAANGAELVPLERSDAPLLRVRIGGKFKAIELFEYDLHFELVEGDRIIKLIEPVVCKECYDEELVVVVAQWVPELLEALEARDSTTDDPPHGDGDVGDGDGDSTEPRPRAIGPLGFAGIGVAVVGLGLTIGGAVEWSRGRVYEQSAGYFKATGKDHGPAGYALVGVGAVATVTGLVMLGVDAGRRAKLRKQARSQVLVIPSLSPSNAGIGIIGRF